MYYGKCTNFDFTVNVSKNEISLQYAGMTFIQDDPFQCNIISDGERAMLACVSHGKALSRFSTSLVFKRYFISIIIKNVARPSVCEICNYVIITHATQQQSFH